MIQKLKEYEFESVNLLKFKIKRYLVNHSEVTKILLFN